MASFKRKRQELPNPSLQARLTADPELNVQDQVDFKGTVKSSMKSNEDCEEG